MLTSYTTLSYQECYPLTYPEDTGLIKQVLLYYVFLLLTLIHSSLLLIMVLKD